MRKLFALLPLPGRDPAEPHRASTQLELFFDLVSVIAIAALTHGLIHAIDHGHGLEKLPVFIFLFVGIWWAWMNFTWFASAYDSDGPFYRVLVMTIMAGELIFAGNVGHAFETLDLGWGIVGWVVMRVGMATLWLRASQNAETRATCLRYFFGILLAQSGWVAFYFLTDPGTPLFFGLGILLFLLEFSVPVFAEKAGDTPFHRHHIIERYGLLTIILLGEVMLAISHAFAAPEGSHPMILPALSGLVLGFSVFWLYFCEEEHLPDKGFITNFIWGYGHVFVFAGIALLAAGISAQASAADLHSHLEVSALSWWLGAPLSLFLLTLWLVRDRHFKLGKRALSLPLMAVAVFVAAVLHAPIWVFAGLGIFTVLWRVPLLGADHSAT